MNPNDTNNLLNNIPEMIKAIQEQENITKEENQRLQKLLQVQEQLIEKQRNSLKEVAETSLELLKVEEKRKELKQKLHTQKTKLLVSSSEGSEVSSIIGEVISQQPAPTAMSKTPSGTTALKVIELIQKQIFGLTESCLQSKELSVQPEILRETVVKVNEVIDSVVNSGNVKESSEDKIRRQSFVITALVQQTDQE